MDKIEPPEEVQINLSATDRFYYKLSSILLAIGIFTIIIPISYLFQLLPPLGAIIPLERFPSLPQASPLFLALLFVVSLVFIVDSVREMAKRGVDSEQLFWNEVHEAYSKSENEPKDAIDKLNSAFSGSTPEFIFYPIDREVRNLLKLVKEKGD